MATNTLSILRPSVNNLSARIFVRAAGLDFEEIDVWGKKGTDEFLAKDPAYLTPLLQEDALPRGSLWESCAIMPYLCNKHGADRFYVTEPARPARLVGATLEFLRAIDYGLPAWAEEYLGAMETALGDAYTEPASDVRGYVESVKGEAIAAS